MGMTIMSVRTNVKSTQFESAYRKAYIRLLTTAASAPKAVDEYFFGTAEERTEDEADVRPHFYGSLAFGLATAALVYVVIL